jgi:competence protein ComEC
LLPGDIEKKVEVDLVRDHSAIDADFLKVPHHGSKASSIEAFVTAVQPRVAVVSVGENNQFGHPVNMWWNVMRAGVRFLRTDRDGEATALTDGQTLEPHICGGAPALNRCIFLTLLEDSGRYSSSGSPTD